MLCLGIESSCDETALALVSDGRLVASVLASQVELHAIFGGVVPELASREHYRYIGPLFDELLARANIEASAIDAVAVARGPGLLGSLLVGVAFAKGLALALQKPFLGINHLHAHLLAIGLEHDLVFPALGVLVSGGHTQLYRIESPTEFIQLGRTLDDAAGEAFDKVGKALGLPYPGGKRIDDLALQGHADPKLLPRVFLDNANLDFSFSGLKTAAAAYIARTGLTAASLNGQENRRRDLADFCASFNHAVAEAICAKAERALLAQPDLKTMWLAGGVAANRHLREALNGMMLGRGGRLLAPSPEFCMDNGAMVAYAGWLLFESGYAHNLDMEAIPRGKKIPGDMLKGGLSQ